MSFRNLGTILAINLVFAFLVGCVESSGEQQSPTASVTVNPAVLAGTASPSPTSTATLIPITQNTPTPPSTQTRTPIPTLSKADAQEFLVELFNTNGGCMLPCWWGITPGKTSAQSALDFLESFAKEIEVDTRSGNVQYFAFFDVPTTVNINGVFEFKLGVESGKITSYYSENHWFSDIDYSLSGLLREYGSPTEVWINAQPVAMDEQPVFSYVLLYPDTGIMSAKEVFATVEDGYVIMCPQKDNMSPDHLWLWPPGMPMTFAEVADGVFVNIGPAFQPPFLKLKEATDIDVDQFYTTYLDPNTDECFNSPAALWP